MEPKKIAEVVTPADIIALIRDKYEGNREADITEDLKRLAGGEPLAYVIGWIPFLGLKIFLELDSHSTDTDLATTTLRPLIPRPETEWWTEKLIDHLKYKFEDRPFTLLDLCAGSGAIGLAVLSAFPYAHVSFGELEPELTALILRNIRENNLDESRAHIRASDLFVAFGDERFDIIASNPPYIPESNRAELNESVTTFEPHNALFAGSDGLDIIKRIIKETPTHLNPDGELWIECDISNIEEAEKLATSTGNFEASIHQDQYGRLRLLELIRV